MRLSNEISLLIGLFEINLILTAQNISGLLPTIISRCLMFKAPTPSADDARSFLKAEGYENLSSQLPLFSNLPLDVIAHQSDSDLFTMMINEFKKGGILN